MYLELSLLFLSAAVFLIALVTVPLLWQIQKIVRSLAVTQEMLQKNLPVIMQNLDEAVANIRKTTITVNTQVEGFSQSLGKIQAILSMIMELESVLKLGLKFPLFNMLRKAGAVAKGIRAFLNVYVTGRTRITR